MKDRKPTIHRAVVVALGATVLSASLPIVTANAADSEDDTLTEVVITGSLLRRTDTETPAPVTILTSESMEERGINTVAEALQRLTANGSGTLNSGWNGGGGNFASGASAASLRGLTVQATLSIFDGTRMAVYPFADDGHRNFVDLNTIPRAAVERVEVLKDGASSTYGADAIAGVINIITKKEVTGLHLNGSVGTAQIGGGTERHLDATWGLGNLASDNYNFYVSAEYQKSDPIWARDLDYPSNSENLSGICDSAGHCLKNNSIWGITNGRDDTGAPFSLITGSTTSYAPVVAPSNAAGVRSGTYQLLNQSAGCSVEQGLYPVTVTAQQLADSGLASSFSPGTYCGADRRNLFGQLQGEDQRFGGLTRFTAKVFDDSELSASLTYYDVKETSNFVFSSALANVTTVPSSVSLSTIVLPIYVCAQGVGTIVNNTNVSTGCNASNGTLNPNNPYAASGQYARLLWRWDGPRTSDTDSKSLRGTVGLSGNLSDSWSYTTDFTYSKVKVELTQDGNPIPQRIADVIANGSFNFVNPQANSEAIRQYVAPTSITNSDSSLWQAQATLTKRLAELEGGPLQALIGASYRHEELFWESANPDNPTAPYTRYYGINAVGAEGSRNVTSPFFEVGAPISKQVELSLSGRYDDYSSGQKNFSPKFGVKFKPVEQLALRGTYSRGFRIPSFNEAFGLPVTGFSSAAVDCSVYVAFCASHGNNSYVNAPYTLGETTAGNPELDPEKSASFTLGFVFEPMANFSVTFDYWNIEIKNLITKLSSDERQAAIDQYYSNNGVVNIPGITVTPGVADTAFPNALPLLGYVSSSFNNSDKENASGYDIGVNYSRPLGGMMWRSELQASYLQQYNITRKNGTQEEYAGTLSPCDYTSCSGSPRLRATWQNTVSWQKLSLTGTASYTSGYDLSEIDYLNVPDDCLESAVSGAGSPTYYGTEIPVQCRTGAQWNFDVNAKYKFTDQLLVYLDVKNIFNIKPEFDPAASYSNAYYYPQYNVAFATENAIGRFVRLGVKFDL